MKFMIEFNYEQYKKIFCILEKNKRNESEKKSLCYCISYSCTYFVMGIFSAGFLTTGFSRSQIKAGNDRQELEVTSMILTETKQDKKFWEIYGETGTYNSEEKVAMLKNVIGNFYKDNEVAMSFESSQGTYNEEKEQIILYDDTYIVIQGDISLKADRLVWSGSNKDIVATGNIKVIKSDELLATGNEIIISPDYNHFKLKGKTVSKIFDRNKNSEKSKKKGILF